ncbi:rod shape-determining protein RodA [Candidatus Blochmannia ocreatus (nom. nud.)]|uniref:Peptidoglycan glycosyltransferase MrdB n=1 Tax=Candidatus Blochmannia ocreatus (nom. nud.) TaxID=251538 RepID=A0ABY4SYM7_9ENTR|nr:rod shape-determining protein RodA [Candidatus Blochmannia ocreatus]URJ25368.1 rod shape-determining protein RodA [Candidatus Blochmannia ocreatus]
MKQIIGRYSIWNKYHIDVKLFLLIIILLLYGIFIMWSACGQNFEIIRLRILQVIGGMIIMLILAQIPPRTYEVLTPYVYVCCIILLILVNIMGQISKGAQRWLDFGIIRFQPSEIVKISVLLMVANYLSKASHPPSLMNISVTLLLIFFPTVFVFLQPDLGTAMLIISSGLFVLFLSGISWKLIVSTLLLIIFVIPIFWLFCMHKYQQDRIKTLLHPELDPLGSGYHIIQSKIAIGSGGFTGKGWLHGTQSRLEFLPERHTDFIFSVLGEELGFLGIIVLLCLYLGIIFRGFFIAISISHMFGRLIVGGFMLVLCICVIVNIGMVSGLLPIVGVPLPLISYGGSSLSGLMAGFGIVMSINGHRKMISKIL